MTPQPVEGDSFTVVRPTVRNSLIFLLVTVVTAGCGARAPVRTFPELQQRVHRGDTVYVIDDTGTETRGRVLELSESALTIAAASGERRMERPAVRQVQTFGDSLWNGLILGLVAGTPGILIADPEYSPCPTDPKRRCSEYRLSRRLLGIGVMGGLGMGIDAMIRGRHQVYLAPDNAAVAVMPVIGPSRAEVRVLVRLP